MSPDTDKQDQEQAEAAASPVTAAVDGDDTSSESAAGDGGVSSPDKKRQHTEGRVSLFNDTIEVFLNKRLPHFDQGPVLAYGAVRKQEEAFEGRYALVCAPDLLPRMRAIPGFANLVNPSLPKILASGVVFWEPTHEERYVFVYESATSIPLMRSLDEEFPHWKLDKLTAKIIQPLMGALMDFRDRDLYHGNIRPTNMFTNRVGDQIMIGECLSTPPSYAQPVLFEPIFRAMANPVARGPGRLSDDLYAFGVSLALLVRTKNHMIGFSDEEVIKQKIKVGTYTALLEAERFPAPLVELLRGLLIDDADQRWGIEEMQGWLDGQRLSPKQSVRSVKASRPLDFNGKEYFWPAILAMDLPYNAAEAVQMVATKHLEQWVERSLEDKMTKARLELITDVPDMSTNTQGSGSSIRCLSKASMALDPSAPMRYQGLVFAPDGFSMLLYQYMAKGYDLSPLVNIIAHKMVPFWIVMQGEGYTDSTSLSSRFDDCRLFLNQKAMGYGIERCVYFLAPDAPCMSAVLKRFYVRTPSDLLTALEKISSRSDRPPLFIDRHIAAFLVIKERKLIEHCFLELNASELYLNVRGNIKVMAAIQAKEKIGPLPGLCHWALDLLEPVYQRYHDRELRQDIREKMEKLADEGALSKMAGILENQALRRDDFDSFRRAMKEYDTLRREKMALERDLEVPEKLGKQTGYGVAAIFSAILAGIITMVFAFMSFS